MSLKQRIRFTLMYIPARSNNLETLVFGLATFLTDPSANDKSSVDKATHIACKSLGGILLVEELDTMLLYK